MDHVNKHLSYLGLKVRDRVSQLEGVVTSVTFDLYGCVQTLVHTGVDKEGTLREQVWFDIARLEVLSPTPVMAQPDFVSGPVAEGLKGPSEKPTPCKS
jgi:hypothetical protein